MNRTTLRIGSTLLLSASSLALATPALANTTLFSTNADATVSVGERVNQIRGLHQIRLDNGAIASFIDAADYRINADGTIDLYAGSVTIAGGPQGATVVRMPEGVEGRVMGAGSAAAFTVGADGEGRGHVLTGEASIGPAGNLRRFTAGEMFEVGGGGPPRQVVSNGPQTTPGAGNGLSPDGPGTGVPVVLAQGEGGPVAAALNGQPIGFADSLAAAGASGDILGAARRVEIAVANPSLETFPSGDFALLVGAAANLEGAYGGTPFNGAQGDIIRTYLEFLAGGGAGADFLTAYAGFVTQYLGLIRSGALPSSFSGASLEQINSFITFTDRTTGFGGLGAQDRTLVNAYLDFIRDGGNPDMFAGRFTSLTQAYFTFVRGGGAPGAFTGASQSTLDAYIAFLSESGLVQQLNGADRALVTAYLQNGGLAFASQYQSALDAYFSFLAAGRLPSEYTAVNQQTLRQYLQTLSDTGLLARITGTRAQFFADYLAFLNGGGSVNGFAGLPANVFAGYTTQLNAYFAFLEAGNLPSAYSGADITQLQGFIAQLQAAGALDRFLGDRASFFASYNAFLAGGGSIDAFSGLNANIFAGYATQLNAYFAFLNGGGLPSDYTGIDVTLLGQYLAQLQAVGALDRFLGAQSSFFASYLAFLQTGGSLDRFAGLNANIFAGYATQLNAYYQYLLNGGLPSGYTALTQAQIQQYLAALENAGATSRFLIDLSGFYTGYFAFLQGGGNPDNFAGLPVPPDFPAFANALNAYAAFLASGGLPSGYTAEQLSVLQQYLDAIVSSGQLASLLGTNATLLSNYFSFLANGGSADGFTGLPVYASYVTQLNAYFAFLQGGGLPGDYTALSAAQIQQYLAALAGAGGFAAYGNLNAFFVDYYAFLQTGGTPGSYASLPVYASYVTQLNAYYAYLAGGGVPSAYTALTQAQIQQYLAALAQLSGGLAGVSNLNSFFGSYFTYISGGGSPDLFTGLPGNGGGSGTSTYAYTGGFTGGAGTRNFYSHGNALVNTASSNTQFEADGAFRTDNGFYSRQSATATAVEISGDQYALIGRFTDGTFSVVNSTFTATPNSGLHYVIVGPTSGSLPTSGVIAYDLLGATSPTYGDGRTAAGSLAATLNVDYGFGGYIANFNGTVTMPDTVYDFTSRSGISRTTALSGLLQGNVTAQSGTNCTSNCRILANYALGGARPGDRFGINYFLEGSSFNISGAALFGAPGTFTLTGGTGGAGTGSSGNTPFAGAVTGLRSHVTQYGLPGATLQSNSNITANFNAAGLLTTYTNANGSTAGSASGPTNTQVEAGNVGGVVAWGRFLDPLNNQGTLDYTGIHAIVGTPVVNIPTSGTVNYSLIGGTLPTTNEGTAAPGSFAGQLAVDFVTRRVGVNLDVAIGQYRWALSTPGGAADPSNGGVSLSSINSDFSSGIQIAGQNAASCTGSCTASIQGSLFGQVASHAGLVYRVLDGTFAARGSAVFAAPGAAGTAITRLGTLPTPPPSGTGFTGTRTGQMLYLGRTGNGLGNSFPGAGSFTNGQLRRLELNATSFFDIGTATVAESGDLTDVAWARWTNGTVTERSGPFTVPTTLGANGGWHVLSGTRATNLPASGVINYTLQASTAVTELNGPETGTLTGAMAVQYGTQSTVGFNFQMNYRGMGWGVSTPGGAGNPGGGVALASSTSQVGFDTVFSSAAGNVTATGGACSTSCEVQVEGALFGSGGRYAGVGLGVVDQGSAHGTIRASGLAILGAQYTYNPYAGTGAGGTSARPFTPDVGIDGVTIPSMPTVPGGTTIGGDWDRWTIPATASLAGDPGLVPVADIAPGLESGRMAGDPLANPVTREQANAALSGLVTFNR